MSKKLIIFVDSDAFVALIKEDDQNHKKAASLFEKLQKKTVTFVTSNYVFSEVATILSQRVNHKTAIAFINSMKSEENVFHVERIDEDIEDMAIKIFIGQTSKNVSFVDCTNVALIRNKHMDGIFSFDHDYKRNNISYIDDLVEN